MSNKVATTNQAKHTNHKKFYKPAKLAIETTLVLLSYITSLMAIVYAYQMSLGMTTARQWIRDARSNDIEISNSAKLTVCLYNALRGFLGIAGAVLNTNFAINGVAPKIINQIQNYFYRSASRSKKDGIISFLKITSVVHILYMLVCRIFDLAISSDLEDPRNRALHWTWGIGAMVSLMVVDIFTIKSFLKKYLVNETPFIEITLNEKIHLMDNPNFSGDQIIQNDVKNLSDFSQAEQKQINRLILRGHYKPVESKNGVTDNHYGLRSWITRISLMLGFTSLSFVTGWANRVIPYGNNPSMPMLGLKYLLYALSDTNSLYIVGVPLLKDPIIKGINKYIVNPLIVNNHNNKSKAKVIASIGTTLVSLSLSLFFYGGYRLFYDKLYPMNFLYNIENAQNFTITNGTALPQYGAMGETINEQIFANFSLGLGIMFEGITFFNLFDTLLNATHWINASAKKKAWIFQSLFVTLTSLLAFKVVPIENQYERATVSLIAGTCYAIAAKLEYNAHQQEKKPKIDYIDEIHEEYMQKNNAIEDQDDPYAAKETTTLNGNKYSSLLVLNKSKAPIKDDKVGGASYFGSEHNLDKQSDNIVSDVNNNTGTVNDINLNPIYRNKKLNAPDSQTSDENRNTINLSNSQATTKQNETSHA